MKVKLLIFSLWFFTFNALIAQENIFDACRQGNIDTVIKLYNIDDNVVNIQEETGYTPLVLACYYGHEDIVSFLVDKVKNLNDKTSYGSPLMAATVKGYENIVDVLLKNKVNPNITDEQGVTAAHYAVLFKNYVIVEKLVNANADFTIKNNVNKSAMDYAIAHNDEKLNKLLNIQKS
ncbi:ankyrin repeat domain-containing protein [Winogradskyella haliclonae]|uniref:Ankyrin repeat-containing protein n=1 Tax=Winogradskyella haliclonae TaxID=2048558 RepID=A0ABQ2C131_9FLAO|nr:ankyrin repeat domain-containing protein [Winogradskyella haliclonae]GGI57920.1 ankyrin repeat-containing protein [Winogradskyella haliclonae]